MIDQANLVRNSRVEYPEPITNSVAAVLPHRRAPRQRRTHQIPIRTFPKLTLPPYPRGSLEGCATLFGLRGGFGQEHLARRHQICDEVAHLSFVE